MSSTYTQATSAPDAAYGGLADAVAGTATIVLAIIALNGVHRGHTGRAVTVFTATLLIRQ
jgi:hypothetical protein